jgi:hypothetical protein
MVKRALVIVLCIAMTSTACASASGGRGAMQTRAVVDPAMMADYVQRIPAGSRVRLEQSNGDVIRGTLMKTSSQSVVVQRSTRVPEPPMEVPLSSVARLTLDTHEGTSMAKAVAIGIASGVGAFFAIIAIVAATFDD